MLASRDPLLTVGLALLVRPLSVYHFALLGSCHFPPWMGHCYDNGVVQHPFNQGPLIARRREVGLIEVKVQDLCRQPHYMRVCLIGPQWFITIGDQDIFKLLYKNITKLFLLLFKRRWC